MSKQDNIATVMRAGEAINTGDLGKLLNVFASDVIDNDPAPDQRKGPQGFVHFFTQLRTSFPDLSMTIDHLVADDDNVSIAYTMRGTHLSPFDGVAATGRNIEVRGLQIERFDAAARVQERWGSTDVLGILQQIGAIRAIEHMDEPPSSRGLALELESGNTTAAPI